MSADRLIMVGHYTKIGKEIREQYLDKTALDMFWLINKHTAYGGRAALIPLLKVVLFSRRKISSSYPIEPANKECKNIRAFFMRTKSLLSNSKKISLTFDSVS